MIYSQGYLQAVGNIGSVLAGEHQLFDRKSGDLAGVCVDPSGNIYVADPVYHVIFKILMDGTVITWAGKTGQSGNNGINRVKGSDARFNEPNGLSIDKSGNLYVADKGNNQIRKISPDQYVTLVAGSSSGVSGFVSGIGSAARFNSPNDVSVDKSGNIYVADTGNHAIRLIQSGISQVNTVSGNGTAGDGYNGWNDDGSLQSVLRSPYSIAVKPNGEVYIMDSGNYKVKLLDKNFRVLRFSGSGTQGDYLGDATTSQYNDLQFSDVDVSGNLYVLDFKEDANSRLLKINGNGIPSVVKQFASMEGDRYVAGVAVNNTGILYVTESDFGGGINFNWIWEDENNHVWEDGNNAMFDGTNL